MNSVDSLLKYWFRILPSGYQVKRFLIVFATRFLFLVISFLIYWSLLKNLPQDIHFNLEVAMVLTLTICTVVFLPIFEKFSLYLKGIFLSEYLLEDASVSRFAYKRFDNNSLIKSVFPDMVKISGSESGKLGILKEDGTFDIYTYNRGRQKKIPTRNENTPMNQLMQFLLKFKNGVSISETVSHPEINSDFIALRADFIVPFLFREKIFGFLAVSNIPDREALHQLIVLSGQCALVIHNQNLSAHIVENLKYRQEEESAKRIQNLLQKGKVPEIDELSIQFTGLDPSTLIEFFQTEDNRWNFLILSAGGPPRSAGLLHSYILGLLYSRLKRGKANNFIEIKTMISETFQKVEWKEKYGYLLGKFQAGGNLEILHEGNLFKVYEVKKPDISITSIGWKNFINANSYPISIDLRNRLFMRIGRA
ncbi:hypothetical protein [Leptospira sp. GIMC2001]|uniref:hypothetical protein n=1 Tax=Leptospira sp. GIMC2001 TaxID=1513297 RepID=UPI00234B534C|nr:hypothetical protein [Leptospira sp. GIMC2001]WCL48963.1 hypothetical protein O4O04_16950 [Leptospira sp. GIMC2001]